MKTYKLQVANSKSQIETLAVDEEDLDFTIDSLQTAGFTILSVSAKV